MNKKPWAAVLVQILKALSSLHPPPDYLELKQSGNLEEGSVPKGMKRQRYSLLPPNSCSGIKPCWTAWWVLLTCTMFFSFFISLPVGKFQSHGAQNILTSVCVSLGWLFSFPLLKLSDFILVNTVMCGRIILGWWFPVSQGLKFTPAVKWTYVLCLSGFLWQTQVFSVNVIAFIFLSYWFLLLSYFSSVYFFVTLLLLAMFVFVWSILSMMHDLYLLACRSRRVIPVQLPIVV